MACRLIGVKGVGREGDISVIRHFKNGTNNSDFPFIVKNHKCLMTLKLRCCQIISKPYFAISWPMLNALNSTEALKKSWRRLPELEWNCGPNNIGGLKMIPLESDNKVR